MEKTMQQEESLQSETENTEEVQLDLPEEVVKEREEEKIIVEQEKDQKEDVKTEEKPEAEEYSESVKKRINKLTYKLREQERQSQEALDFAKKDQDEN